MFIVGGVVEAWPNVDDGVGGEVGTRRIRAARASRLSVASTGTLIASQRETMLSSAQSMDS